MSNTKELLILKIVCASTLFVVFLEGVGLVLLWKQSELEIEFIREEVDSLKMTISSIQEKRHTKVSVFWEKPLYTAMESDGSVTVKLISSKPVPFNYTVQVSATDISAQRLIDYVFLVMDVTFLANETEKKLNIIIVEDNIDELDEIFILTVSSDKPDVEVGNPNVTTLLIKDSDVINVRFSPPDYSVREGENVSLRVILDKVPAKPVTVTINITDVSTNSDDYIPRTCTLTFLAGETENEDCIISARSDDVKELECGEDLRADLSIPKDQPDVMIEDPDMALVTIVDNYTDIAIDRDTATIIGDPLFEVPLPNPEDYEDDPVLRDASLCYEVHGASGQIFNLISDGCTSVNALYKEGVLPNATDLNFMSKIGIAADGVSGQCHNIEFDVDGCKALFDGSEVPLNGISSDGICVRRRGSDYTYIVSVPNCGTTRRLMMWLSCVNTTRLGKPRDDGLNFRVLYADGLRPTSHGLLGQFWNIPLNVTKYNGPFGDKPMRKNAYTVTILPPGSSTTRSFVAHRGPRLWDFRRKPCLYAGNIHAGPAGEVEKDGSVIEGKYTDYRVNDLFSIYLENPDFSKYTGNCTESFGTPSSG